MTTAPAEIITVGDRVRLTVAVSKTMMKNRHRPRYGVDWYARRGTVTNIGEYNRSVTVRWDGLRALDIWPLKAIKVVGHGNRQ